MVFKWTAELTEQARVLYVEALASPGAIADALGTKPTVIRRKAFGMGWTKLRPAEVTLAARKAALTRARAIHLAERHFRWTREALDTLRAMYGRGCSPKTVADALGPPCGVRTVIKKASALGIKRDLTAALREAGRAGALARWGERPERSVVTAPRRPVVDAAADRAAIDAAIAAGKVTILPAGQAAGISRWELALHTAPAPRPKAEDDPERRRRAGHKAALVVASGYRRPRKASA